MCISFFSYFPCDPPYVTDDLRDAGSFKNAMEKLKSEMDNLQKELKNSVPFFSSRYKVSGGISIEVRQWKCLLRSSTAALPVAVRAAQTRLGGCRVGQLGQLPYES